MFKSKINPRIFTQYEHGRLAGTLAQLWGNTAFERPPLPFEPFVEGVTFHDWGYGVVDNVPIGEANEAEWLTVIRRGVEISYDHPVTDLIIKRHLHRLLLLDPTPARQALAAEVATQMSVRLAASGLAERSLACADLITRLCDMISFDFCFERPTERTLPIFAHDDDAEPRSVTYQIGVDGVVRVDPWPFERPIISTVVIAFAQTGFPDRLIPEVVPFVARPA